MSDVPGTVRSATATARVAWRARRVRSMSPVEVALRLRDRARLEVWRRRRTWAPPRFVATPVASGYRFPIVEADQAIERVVQLTQSLLEGRLVALGQAFALDETHWGRDPQSGRTAPLCFGPLIDYRDRALVGNVRNVWELNRHQHLSMAALAYALTGEERFARFVSGQLTSWLGQNPFPLGVNWSSPLELGLRLISWVWIARFLAGGKDWETLFGDRGLMWPAVYRHQWMVAGLHSVGSSANNHLIGEMSGLFISALEWPWFEESAAWMNLAGRSLEEEIRRQYYPSGVNREQAFGYHVFATELLLLAAVEGERAGRPFSEGYRDGLRRAVVAATAQTGPGGLQPAYGDSDDGVAIGHPGGAGMALERVVATAAATLGGVDCGAGASPDAWLAATLQSSGVRPPRPAVPRVPGSAGATPRTRSFRDAGLFVMTSVVDDEAVVVLADAGELGYLSIAAHGHADSLSFTLAVGDEQLLVDPGTFTYHYEPEARAYFRGTRAHNTVCVDGEDQSQAGGPFLWTTKARTTVREWRETENGATLAASHDGYERLAGSVTHRRRLVLAGGRLTVADELLGAGEHTLEWRLHVAPHCDVRLGPGQCDIIGRSHRVSLRLDDALRWSRLVGHPLGGWYSRAFNERERTTTLVGTACLTLPVRLDHVLQVNR